MPDSLAKKKKKTGATMTTSTTFLLEEEKRITCTREDFTGEMKKSLRSFQGRFYELLGEITKHFSFFIIIFTRRLR